MEASHFDFLHACPIPWILTRRGFSQHQTQVRGCRQTRKTAKARAEHRHATDRVRLFSIHGLTPISENPPRDRILPARAVFQF